jgi:hypothetical protein
VSANNQTKMYREIISAGVIIFNATNCYVSEDNAFKQSI